MGSKLIKRNNGALATFVKENKGEILELINMKVQLVKSVLDYQKVKEEHKTMRKALKVKIKEIEANKIIELEKIKSSLEQTKMEYQSLIQQREFEHKEIMEKLEIIKNQLKEGNELIKEFINENKNEEIINQFYKFQIEAIKTLKEI